MEECPFCAIIEGKLKAYEVYSDDKFLAVLDIRPANKGHVIIFPKRHIKSIFELTDEELVNLSALARGISLALLECCAEGINILYSMGSVAGQTVPHMFVHIIPRVKGDKVHLVWEPLKLSEEEFEKIKEAVKSHISKLDTRKKEEKVVMKEEPKISSVKLPPPSAGYWD